MNTRINHLAVWVLVVVYFLIGWGWYAIWGDTWLNLHAKTATDIERTHAAGAYVLAFIASIVVNYVLPWLISRLHAQRHVCWVRVDHFFKSLFPREIIALSTEHQWRERDRVEQNPVQQ